MLLCAILSDTLNLRGPTTTKWDQFFVAVLAEIAEIEDIQLLASQQFKAKSRERATASIFLRTWSRDGWKGQDERSSARTTRASLAKFQNTLEIVQI